MRWSWPAARARARSARTGPGVGCGIRGLRHGPGQMPGQHDMNVLLAGLSDSDREVLAGMPAEAFRSGVHETLVILHAAAVPPFQDRYEGSPYHDFVGRMEGWRWLAS
jgi:hypothetical protein